MKFKHITLQRTLPLNLIVFLLNGDGQRFFPRGRIIELICCTSESEQKAKQYFTLAEP